MARMVLSGSCRISRAAGLSSTTSTAVSELLGDNPGRRARGASLKPYGEHEGAADSRFAFQPDSATHELDQPPANGQPQPRAAVLARGRHVSLRKRLEEPGRLLLRHADARVAHRELELHLVACALKQVDVQANLAALGELDCVIDEVGEDLTETQRSPRRNSGISGDT